jgi:transposase
VSLQSGSVPPVPEQTAAVARRAFRRPPLAVRLRDEFGGLYQDGDFAALFPGAVSRRYRPGASRSSPYSSSSRDSRTAGGRRRARPDRLEVRLSLELTDSGFDYSVLSEFRARLVAGGAEHVLLDRLLAHAAERGLVKARTKQRTDSTHVLAAVRTLNRLELVGESVRAALNALAATAPDWLRAVAPPEWHARYDHRFEEARMPATDAARERPAAHFGGGRRRAAGRRRRAYRAARAPRAASRRGAPPGARALLRPRARGRRAVGR